MSTPTSAARRRAVSTATGLRSQPAIRIRTPARRAFCHNRNGTSPETGLLAAWPKEGPPKVWEKQVGEGYSGPVVAGIVGTRKFAFDIWGETVNLASRIEGLTKQHGAAVLVSDSTRAQAPSFQYAAAEPVPVKGKSQPVATFAPSRPAQPA